MQREALAFWLREPGVGEIRRTTLAPPRPEDVAVRTLRSAVSRGTESLVFGGHVPPSQYDAMRAPFQDGDFPGPVKYGYLNVGVVEDGPAHLRGRTVFCLHPHQTAYVVPASAVTVVPDDVPVARAVLAGIVETAVNALWDAAPLVGDRVAVVGRRDRGLLRGPAARAHPRRLRHARRRRPRARRRGGRARGGLRPARPGAERARPGLPHQRDLRGPAAVAGAAGAGGHGHRAQLVRRRRRRRALARGQLPLRSARPSGPARWARWRRPDEAVVRRPTGSRSPSSSSATRRSTACSPASRPFETLPDVMPRLVSRELPALCHAVTYDTVEVPCSA